MKTTKTGSEALKINGDFYKVGQILSVVVQAPRFGGWVRIPRRLVNADGTPRTDIKIQRARVTHVSSKKIRLTSEMIEDGMVTDHFSCATLTPL